ncbi:MAG: pitrilysin family protein [Acidobacteriota bacterium]
MSRRSSTLLVLSALLALPLTASAATILPANVEQLDSLQGVTQYRLKSNGMTLLLAPNHAAPVFTFLVVYHVGSRNEAPGNTGSAHLLEHMLFNKSTENFGRAKGHKTFQEVLFEAGADFSTTNMTTWFDRMNGYSTLPSDKLELAMRIEADRLARGLILDEERRPEMTVVRNEYEIGENSPYEALDKEVVATAIQAHPYHWSTVGYRSDIEGVSTDTLRQHYRDFFWPDNSEAILVGDFDPAAALALFDQQFGALPRSSHPIPQVITVEPPQEGERRTLVKRPGQVGVVQIGYIRPGALHPDFIPLDVLAEILGDGINSRLHQALVETGLASDAAAWNQTLRDPYPFMVQATVGDGKTQQQVEDALKAALAKVVSEGVTTTELERAKRQIEVGIIRSRDGAYPFAQSLGEAVASANWKWFLGYVDMLKAVSASDVQRVARTYLVADHATVGWFVPTAAETAPVAAAAAATSPAPDSPPGTAASPQATSTPAPAAAVATVPSTTFAARTLHKVLANGIILDIVENHQVPTVAVGGVLLAGDVTAPSGHPALPQLAADMVQRGTKHRDKQVLAAQLDGAGARLALTNRGTEIAIAGGGLSRDTHLLLGVLAEELEEPAWSEDELGKAKAEEKNAILLSDDDTDDRAIQKLQRLIFPEGHPNHAPSAKEQVSSLERATVAELRSFHQQRYVGSSLILTVVGDVDSKAVARDVAALFGALPKGTRPTPSTARVSPGKAQSSIETIPGKANMTLMFGFASGLRRNDPDYDAALLANAALGQSGMSSRLGVRVRDTEGLSYNLSSRFLLTDFLDGFWEVSVAVAPANLAKALHSTRDEIEKYCREGITEDEVAVQKSYFAGNFQVRLGNNAGVATALATAEKFGYGPAYLDEFPNRIRKVTREQVNAAIQAHMHPAQMNLVVAGDLTELPKP